MLRSCMCGWSGKIKQSLWKASKAVGEARENTSAWKFSWEVSFWDNVVLFFFSSDFTLASSAPASVPWPCTRCTVLFFLIKEETGGSRQARFAVLCAGGFCPPWPQQRLTTPSTTPACPHGCPALPVPASGILKKEVAGQSLREAVRCKRDGKNWFCAKFICCCKRSAQEKYREFVAVSVRISLEKLDWNLWKLKWEKWVWPDTLTWAQRDSSGLFCWSTAEDMETWHYETVVHIDNFQGIFMDNRINGHASISRGQLVHKSACWLHFSQTAPECLPSSGRLAQG